MDGSKAEAGSSEALGEQAKYFVESRLLQREISIILETANNNNVVGSILHPVSDWCILHPVWEWVGEGVWKSGSGDLKKNVFKCNIFK